MADPENEYTHGRSATFKMDGGGCHIDFAPKSFLLRFDDNEWLVEWHRWFGPCRLNKHDESPCQIQPGEKHHFWLVVQWWKDQGARVEEGVAIWHEPPLVEKRYRRYKGDLLEDEAGSIVRRYYYGYESWGPVRKS